MMAALINPQPYYPNNKANSECTHVKLPKNKYKYSLKRKKKNSTYSRSPHLKSNQKEVKLTFYLSKNLIHKKYYYITQSYKTLFVFETESHVALAVQQWLWNPDSPTSVSEMLGIQACVIISDICVARKWTQDLLHAKQAFYQMSHISRSYKIYWNS